MKHVIQYTESERSWGGEVWYAAYATKEEALSAMENTNEGLPTDYVPDYYIFAEYVGEMTEVPKGYKI